MSRITIELWVSRDYLSLPPGPGKGRGRKWTAEELFRVTVMSALVNIHVGPMHAGRIAQNLTWPIDRSAPLFVLRQNTYLGVAIARKVGAIGSVLVHRPNTGVIILDLEDITDQIKIVLDEIGV